jgi:hypothetical protein
MNLLTKILLLTILVTLFSCEKEISLDLDESEQKIVIEGTLHDSIGDNQVLISKTRPFNDNGPIQLVSNATVQIIDNNGITYNLYETKPGVYSDSLLLGIQNTNYTLVVSVEGEVITASSFMPTKVELDSLVYEKDPDIFQDDLDNPSYQMRSNFTDPIGFGNYYQFKAYVDNTQEKGFVILNDDLIDGKSTSYPLFRSEFFENDTVTVALLSTAEFNFTYFNGLVLSQSGDVPGNPISNFDNPKAVGYFTASTKSTKKIVIVAN